MTTYDTPCRIETETINVTEASRVIARLYLLQKDGNPIKYLKT
jgi:hypothetical protein